jgi:hypothetical protein
MTTEKKYIITYLTELGEFVERTDYGLSDEEIQAHYKQTGLNIVSIVRG